MDYSTYRTEDHREAARAFVEKRRPKFHGEIGKAGLVSC